MALLNNFTAFCYYFANHVQKILIVDNDLRRIYLHLCIKFATIIIIIIM